MRFPALRDLPGRRSRPAEPRPTVLNAANEIAVAEFVGGQARVRRHSGPGRGNARGRGADRHHDGAPIGRPGHRH